MIATLPMVLRDKSDCADNKDGNSDADRSGDNDDSETITAQRDWRHALFCGRAVTRGLPMTTLLRTAPAAVLSSWSRL